MSVIETIHKPSRRSYRLVLLRLFRKSLLDAPDGVAICAKGDIFIAWDTGPLFEHGKRSARASVFPKLERHFQATAPGVIQFDCTQTFAELERLGLPQPAFDRRLLRMCIDNLLAGNPDTVRPRRIWERAAQLRQ